MRFDPVQGLFGLALSAGNPKLDDPAKFVRLAVALDRTTLVTATMAPRFTEQIMPQQLDLPHSPTTRLGGALPMDRRRHSRDESPAGRYSGALEGRVYAHHQPMGRGLNILFACCVTNVPAGRHNTPPASRKARI